ncbi:type II toxin-antitoxin system Phd/YefM family antitoxin [Mycolicibacterium agri]|uniref:type II toxin-antitoxin system Phd/YefM family antitoxin n=1 Tax=Mycolicibacterium agri TaxID=36811 RepID=UPI0013D17F67
MKSNSITLLDIRINLDEILSRIAAGEHLVITRHGKPVAELHPLRPEGRRKEYLRHAIPSVPPSWASTTGNNACRPWHQR